MDITIRTATPDDLSEIGRVDGASFGAQYSEQELSETFEGVDLERFFVACDGDAIAGIAGDYPFTMTVPGGSLEVPGVTWVSVAPTYRRRGILRQMMEFQLHGYAERGVPVAILTASEGAIYRRFGYGAATSIRKTVVDRRRAVLSRPADPGEVRLAKPAEARAVLPALHERWRAQVPGAVSRNDSWWDHLFRDREYQRGGMSGKFYLLHDEGYVAYRVKADWGSSAPNHTCWITDYAPVTPRAHAALWQVLLGMDLFGVIETYQIPVDDPLPFLITDYRQVQTTAVNDGIWLRPIDVAAMLSSRTYGVEIDAVVEVTDPMFGDARYQLRGGPDGATCQRTEASIDVSLTADALGSVYLGGNRARTLAAAGAIHADDDATLDRFDRALLADRAPSHGTAF
ncbi:MAG TPA: GNAT family N-acetyltransferase [Jatrophihabitans sp.]|jgi:predicted acetyltransferase